MTEEGVPPAPSAVTVPSPTAAADAVEVAARQGRLPAGRRARAVLSGLSEPRK